MITPELLVAMGVAKAHADEFAGPLDTVCKDCGLNTPQRASVFIAQCAVESALFSVMSENLNYTDPARITKIFGIPATEAQHLAKNPQELANRAYANRNGNGNEASGDGWKYRGRGPIQLTGKRNYTLAGLALKSPYGDQPDLVSTPLGGCFAAGWYWMVNGLNRFADVGNIDGVTRAINGPGMLAAEHRRDMSAIALKALLTA